MPTTTRAPSRRASARTAALVGLALLLLASREGRAAARPDLHGDWQGSIAGGGTVATLAQHGSRLTGTMSVDAADVHGTFALAGRAAASAARLHGRLGRSRLSWRGTPAGDGTGWSGPLAVRGGGRHLRGVLVLSRSATGGVRCGDAFFASDVMPHVLEPICAQCHVPTGLAANAPFRVTVGDPLTTSLSALREVDFTSPSLSKILRKPRAEIPHGGGQRIVAGSPEDAVLVHWVTLVTAPGCGTGSGGGGGGPRTPAELYADDCASCHGPDARGLQGPNIRCNRSIHDTVRNGRTGPAGTMPAFPDLSDADIAGLQAWLESLCPPGAASGADLFAGNCADCHGADAGGAGAAPNVRCATRVADAVTIGRGAAMPSFPDLVAADVSAVIAYLGQLCTTYGRTGDALWAGNCSTCHGATAHGGRSGLGVAGPDIACTDTADYAEAVRFGEDRMPAFPALDAADVSAIVSFVRGTFCPGG